MIAKYTTNLYASEVYRELERQAVRKGYFEPTDEEIVKAAAASVNQTKSINEPVDVAPLGDIVQDIARLAYAMRRKGFVTQADDIEQKLVLYKQAESALYNVTPEKNQDFIDLAHPEGDYQVEGFGELGAVETVESAAAKIRAVTEKNPTGKLAALAAEIVKKGVRGRPGVARTQAQPEGRRVPQTAFETATAEWVRARDAAPALGTVTFEGQNGKDPGIQAVYSKYAKVPIANIKKYFQIKDILAKAGLLNADATLNTTKFTTGGVGSTPGWVVPAQRAAQALGVGDYFSGVSGISKADSAFGIGSSRQWPGGQNANSIYLEDLTWGGPAVNQRYVGSTSNIGKLAGELTTKWNAIRAAAWGTGDHLWKTAGDKIKTEAESIIQLIKDKKIDESGVVLAGVLDVSKGTAAVRTAGKAVKDEYAKYKDTTLAALNKIAPAEKQKIDTWVAGIKNATDTALSKLVEGDAIWGENVDVGGLVSSLQGIKSKMDQVISKDDASTRNRQAAQTNRNEIQRLINTLSRFSGGGRWVSLQPTLTQFDLGNPGSWSDAQAAIRRNYVSAAGRWADGILGEK